MNMDHQTLIFQWQNIAINVYQSLTSNAGVLFYGIIEVV